MDWLIELPGINGHVRHSMLNQSETTRNSDGTFVSLAALEPGQRYGKLTVVSKTGKKGHNWLWRCKCDCGGQVDALASNLRSGNTTSCGCHRRNATSARRLTHGLSTTRAYSLWQNMMRRCYEASNPAYPNYGGRGITVCERWHDFAAFFADMGERPTGKSLDRRDNSLGYSPLNCRWATKKEQMNNKRDNVLATIDGVTQTVAQWAEQSGIPAARIRARRRIGWGDNKLLLPKRAAG